MVDVWSHYVLCDGVGDVCDVMCDGVSDVCDGHGCMRLDTR